MDAKAMADRLLVLSAEDNYMNTHVRRELREIAAELSRYVPQSDAIELAKEMWLTLDGNRGYALTITAARTKRIAEEFLKMAAPDWLCRISHGSEG